jgi:hypothetical protein
VETIVHFSHAMICELREIDIDKVEEALYLLDNVAIAKKIALFFGISRCMFDPSLVYS